MSDSYAPKTPCDVCGGEAEGGANRRQIGNKTFCSMSCLHIHSLNFRKKLMERFYSTKKEYVG